MTPGLPRGAVVKNPPVNAGDGRDASLIPGSGISPEQEVATHSTPGFLPGKFHGQRSLAGYSPRGHKESDTTERIHRHTQTDTHTHTHLTLYLGNGKRRDVSGQPGSGPPGWEPPAGGIIR